MKSTNNMSHSIRGAKDSLPLILAAMPFGIVFGALGHAQGLSDWVVMAISIFVFAGASQFIAVTLLASGATLPVIILTVFVVNLRHSLYAVSLIPFVRHFSSKIRVLMGFLLTDETFAVAYNEASKRVGQSGLNYYYFGSAGLMYLNWQLCTWIGIVTGNQFPQLTEFGLDVAMVVAFIGIVVPHLKMPSHWLCAVVAGVGGVLTYEWPHQTGLLFCSVLAISVGVLSEIQLNKRARGAKETND